MCVSEYMNVFNFGVYASKREDVALLMFSC